MIPPGNGATSHSLATVYTRDGRGRVTSCARVLDGTNTLAAVNYEYDALGRLANKRVGNNAGSGASSKLETAYAYDLHGWTTEIAAGQRSTQGVLDTLFAESLYYASALKDSPAARFDGNISETGFKHRVGSSPSYSIQTNTWSYDYDGLKRLTDAYHFAGSSQSSSLTDTEQGIEYDLNGNIKALMRYGPSGLENDLSFLHTGNRMTSLTDANATGGDAGAKAFTYDANGNLTHDGRKDLDIQWNIFNLASSAVTHDGSLTYARLSDGTLVSSQNTSGSSTTGKRYCGSFVFTTGTGITTPQVESIAWDEGRIFRNAQTGAYQDCWFAGDHLGDVRSVMDISPNLSSPVVLEQNDYLPYGTKIANPLHARMNANRWRYAGKEEFPEMNLMDFGARLYDSFTARWTAVDKEAGKFPKFGSFVYCGSNPILHKEVDGNIWDTAIDAAFLAFDVGSAIYHGVKGNHEAARQSLKNVGEDLLFAAIPGATVAVARVAKVAAVKGAEVIRGGSKAFKELKYAGEFGMDSYRSLRNAVTKAFGKNSGLEVHHLIEQRFAEKLGLDPNKMVSVVLTEEEHQRFTNLWRKEIGYARDLTETTTNNATKEQILEAAKRIYKDYPEFLRILGL